MKETKIVLAGVGGVGKSALTINYVTNVWVHEYDPTIEDCHRKQVLIDGEVDMLDILDTAGQEEYSLMQDQWFRGGEGFYVVYSIINRRSFESIPQLIDKVVRVKENCDKVPIVLVGNKCDLEEERVVSIEEGEALARQYNCKYFETSAKNYINIDESFAQLVREIRTSRDCGASKKFTNDTHSSNHMIVTNPTNDSKNANKKKKKGHHHHCILL